MYDVHACLAQCNGRKNMRDKPEELRKNSGQFDLIFCHLANHLRHEKRLARVLSRICVVLSIFGREYLPCDKFGVDSAV